jgi:hypothetical protein
MSFVAEASIAIAVEPEIAFDRLADHSSWREWMPKSFRPVGAPLGVLSKGAKPRVRIAPMPRALPIEVTTVERAREITWRGGNALLSGEHRFLFEKRHDGMTIVRSIETWRGVLAPLLRPIVKPAAERVGRQQLQALAESLRVSRP